MSKIPNFAAIRIVPREKDFLDRRTGAIGEIFYDRNSDTLRLFGAGQSLGGTPLATEPFVTIKINESLEDALIGYATEQFVSTAISNIPPPNLTGLATEQFVNNAISNIPEVDLEGLATEEYVNSTIINVLDGDSSVGRYITLGDLEGLATEQYVDDAVAAIDISGIDLTGYATETYVDNAIIALNISSYATETFVTNSISNISLSLNSLSDVDTASSPPTPGQVLKWTGSVWAPGTDVAEGGAGLDAETLGGFSGSYYLNYNNFTNKPDLTLLAPKESPTFTGTVSGITAAMVGLGNVTNESKATMFTSPTFTGTVSGVTATMVGLGNVTNESKATMFTSPTFTGTVSGVTKAMVGLGNVTNESKATMFTSPTFTGTVTLSSDYKETISNSTGSSTIDLALGTIHRVAADENTTTITLPNSVAGKSFIVIVNYEFGVDNLNWSGGGVIKWVGGSPPIPTKTVGKTDIFTFFQDGTFTYASIFGQNF